MLTQRAIALARVENSIWSWELKLDECSLFRWYLDGTIETNLRGSTLEQAETALRRFVDASLRGDLVIALGRIGTDFQDGRLVSGDVASSLL